MSKLGESRFAYMPARMAAKRTSNLSRFETAQRAIALADWFAAEQLRILNAGRTQRRIERLQRLITANRRAIQRQSHVAGIAAE